MNTISPTIQKILKQFDHVFDSEGHEDPLFLSLTQDYRQFLQRSCVEYALAITSRYIVTPLPPVRVLHADMVDEYNHKVKYSKIIIQELQHNIQQDSLDLPTN